MAHCCGGVLSKCNSIKRSAVEEENVTQDKQIKRMFINKKVKINEFLNYDYP
jgi:hypothetical protein